MGTDAAVLATRPKFLDDCLSLAVQMLVAPQALTAKQRHLIDDLHGLFEMRTQMDRVGQESAAVGVGEYGFGGGHAL